MKTKIAKLVLALAIALALQTMAVAEEKIITVSAKVPPLSGVMDVMISSIDPADPVDLTDDVWTKDQSSVNFGTLIRIEKDKIFTGSSYYAVDVVVLDNTGRSWTLTHTAAAIIRRPLAFPISRLDDSITVAFAKVMRPRGATKDEETPLSRGTYRESNNAQFDRAKLEGGKGGWLRIYYGIATGNPDPSKGTLDPAGAFPISQYQLGGDYSGGVTLTLTPQ